MNNILEILIKYTGPNGNWILNSNNEYVSVKDMVTLHNDDPDCYDYIFDIDNWENEEMLQKAIDLNHFYELTWHPNNSVGSYHFYAPTLVDLERELNNVKDDVEKAYGISKPKFEDTVPNYIKYGRKDD